MTIFEKIAAKEIPARIVHETEDFMAVQDVNPQAPVHVLIVPKACHTANRRSGGRRCPLLGRMLIASGEIARKMDVFNSGYRLVINNGRDAGESVPHLHIHLLGGRPLQWPPG